MPPIEGEWYWVRIGDEWSPAMRRENCIGGWTNLDTWKDFDLEVVEWQKIRPPVIYEFHIEDDAID